MIEILLNLGIYYPNKLSVDVFRNILQKDNINLLRLLCRFGYNIFGFPNDIFDFPNTVFENLQINDNEHLPLVINELFSVGYSSANSLNFRECRIGTKNNLEAMLALGPLVRAVYPIQVTVGDNTFVQYLSKMNFTCVSIILGFIGKLPTNHHGEFLNFSRILTDNFVFTSNLQGKRRGFVCSLLQDTMFPEILQENDDVAFVEEVKDDV